MSRLKKSTLVSVVSTDDPVNGPKIALDQIHADDILRNYKRILIKPNYVNGSHPPTGVTTDPRVVRRSSSTCWSTAGAAGSSRWVRAAWQA